MRSVLPNTAPYLLLTTTLACGDPMGPLDIGDNKPPTQRGASLVEYAGEWEGYVEAFKFFDGSDRVRLRVAADGSGSIEVGESPEPPAPDTEDPASALTSFNREMVPGFRYRLTGAEVESNRMRVQLPVWQPADAWCALFTNPVPSTSHASGYACLPDLPIDHDADGDRTCIGGHDGNPPSCGLASCSLLCECDATSCNAGPLKQSLARLDAALEADGDALVGTLRLFEDRRPIVRLRRVQGGAPAQPERSLADYAGEWEGYIEAFTLLDHSDRVHLRVAADGSGSFEFGTSAPPPPPDMEEPTDALISRNMDPLPGFQYRLSGVHIERGRIRLDVPVWQPADAWCALFDPVFNPDLGQYSCLDHRPTEAELDAEQCLLHLNPYPTSCGVACTHACECDADTCSAGVLREASTPFDAELQDEDQKLVGTLRLSGNRRLVVRMQRE